MNDNTLLLIIIFYNLLFPFWFIPYLNDKNMFMVMGIFRSVWSCLFIPSKTEKYYSFPTFSSIKPAIALSNGFNLRKSKYFYCLIDHTWRLDLTVCPALSIASGQILSCDQLIISWLSIPSSFWNISLSCRILPHISQAPFSQSSLFSHFYCHLMVLSVKVQLQSSWIYSLATGPKMPIWPGKKREMVNER